MIIARSPLRITLGGGGTDLASYYGEHEGFLVSAAIDKYVYVTVIRPFSPGIYLKYSALEQVEHVADVKHPIIREALALQQLELPQIEITTLADIPAGTGLGSSGSFTTALLKALYTHQRKVAHSQELAEVACDIEINRLGEPIGKQDQYIAAYGGITGMTFHKDHRVTVQPLRVSLNTMFDLEDNLLLFFTGFNRAAGAVLKDQHVRSQARDGAMLRNLDYVKSLGYRRTAARAMGAQKAALRGRQQPADRQLVLTRHEQRCNWGQIGRRRRRRLPDVLCCGTQPSTPGHDRGGITRGSISLRLRRYQGCSVLSMFPVAILAGGLATRLRPLTDDTPKALLRIAGQPFIFHQLQLLGAQGVDRVVLCVGHLGEQIRTAVGDGRRFGLTVSYSFDGRRLLGTGGAVCNALPSLGNNFFVLNGDSYLTCRFAQIQSAYEAAGRPALMAVLRNDNRWDRSNVCFINDEVVEYDKNPERNDLSFIDIGVCVFSSRVFAPDTEAAVVDLGHICRNLAQQRQLAGFEVSERFYEVGSPQGILDTETFLSQRLVGA
jgi:D-glycero-alpha-D-manno-heptose-7-phosphate kinase